MKDIQQNVYDNETFFQGYKKIRDNVYSANDIEEKPAIFSLLPNIKGKRILDLGCGYGENCKRFIELGASYVMGVDISEKMLAVANKYNCHENISFQKMRLEDIHLIDEKFDIVISSLAFHYIADFDKLIRDISNLLVDEGYIIFSQEHPITTAPLNGINWIEGEEYVEGMVLTDYAAEGLRDVAWIIDHVIKYHRTVSTIINTLIQHDFIIQKLLEPTVSKEIAEKEKCLSRCWHAPDFLLVKAQKK